jgi:hypothetical protein
MNYEIINGKKLKKCPDDKIRNPITLRCIKNDYDFINGKKLKKCPDNKIRNPISLRCINKTKPTKTKVIQFKEPRLKELKPKEPRLKPTKTKVIQFKEPRLKPTKTKENKDKYANIIQKNLKNLIDPYINRKSPFIKNRINYSKFILKKLNIHDNEILSFYKFDNDDKPSFKLGSDIILIKDTKTFYRSGIIYSSKFANNNLLKFAIKLFYAETDKQTNTEIKLNESLSNLVLNEICPHFPIVYKDLTGTLDKNSIDIKNKNIPLFFNEIYYSSKFNITIRELFDSNIITLVNFDTIYIKNLLIQTFLSLAFMHHYEEMFQMEGKFNDIYYNKIKKGGYFHYYIYNNHYYLENIGYLGVLTNFLYASNKYTNINIYDDFFNIIYNAKIYIKKDNEEFYNFFKLLDSNFSKFDFKITKKNFNKTLKDYVIYYLDLFASINLIHKSLPSNSYVINAKPYIIVEK